MTERRKQSLTPDQRARLRRHLANRNTPCPRCEYNLRGLESDTCPECGEPLSYTKVRRGLPPPKDDALALTTYAVRTIGVLVSTVIWDVIIFVTVAAILVLTMGFRVSWTTVGLTVGALGIATALLAACVILLVRLERRSHRFADLPPITKWTIAGFACIAAAGVLWLMIASYMR